MTETIRDVVEPVRRLATDPEAEPTDGVAVCLVNWGYAIADAGLRAHVSTEVTPDAAWPYLGGVS